MTRGCGLATRRPSGTTLAIEGPHLEKALSSGNQAGEMEALLWLPLEKDAHIGRKERFEHWTAAPPWRVNVPNQKYVEQNVDQDSDRNSKLLQKLWRKPSLNTATQALTTGGHDFSNLPLETVERSLFDGGLCDRARERIPVDKVPTRFFSANSASFAP